MDGGNLTSRPQSGLYLLDAASAGGGIPAGFAVAGYEIEASTTLGEAAEALAIEQSLGTRDAPPDVRDRHGARVVSVDELDGGGGFAEVAFPVANLGSLPALLVAVAGEALETRTFERLRLVALGLPNALLDNYSGPQFGISGVRETLDVRGRPLTVAILKPSVGLGPDEAASLAAELAGAGADVIKDDELNSTIDGFDVLERASAVSESLAWIETQGMSPKAYAANVTGPIDRLPDTVDSLAVLGNVWPMLCDQAVGIDAVRMVAQISPRPILCHRAYGGGSFRGRDFGVSASVLAGLVRLAGGDLVHCGGLGGKLCDRRSDALANIKSCRAPLGGISPAMPILGGGYWAGSVAAVRKGIGDDDFAFVFGSGVTEHPDGAGAGMRSVAQAIKAAVDGRAFDDISSDADVRGALEAFGPPWTEDDLGE